RFEPRGVRWVRQETRQGKNAALNRLAPLLKGEIWVFTDANAMLERDALRRLVAPFADPCVGLACGELRYGWRRAPQSARHKLLGGLESFFWRFDQWLKSLESRFGCLIGANGAIFALRRSQWKELDLAVPNDFIQCALTAADGAWTLYEPAARAWEAPSERVRQEFDRRVRIITRGLRALRLAWRPAWRGRRLLLLYGMISRKWLRRLQPLLLLGLFAANCFLLGEAWARWLLALQAAGYGLGALSGLACWAGARSRVLLAPFYFLTLNAAAATALWRFARGQSTSIWSVQREELASLSSKNLLDE
ncbi:MAG: glycosyltransferase, partial [Candidatus Sumerlaeota bacterium]|nr:glycosyltransferase [Candidatus Sumerlaeota bacterium]